MIEINYFFIFTLFPLPIFLEETPLLTIFFECRFLLLFFFPILLSIKDEKKNRKEQIVKETLRQKYVAALCRNVWFVAVKSCH